jgi:ABC-type transport system involved in cytochrome bd biosynthesis fused ATPase/permease subunit
LGCGLLVGSVLLPVAAAVALDQARVRLVRARGTLAVRSVDIIEGAEDLAVCGASAAATERERDAARTVARLERSVALRGATAGAAGLLVRLVTTGAVAVLAARAQDAGRLGPVTVTVLTLTALAAVETSAPVQAAAERFGELGHGLRRLREVLRARPPVPEPAHPRPVPAGPLTLEFNDVTVVPPGASRAALSGFGLSLPPGRKVALVGPSGAGKSTVLAAALGFVRPRAGQVTLNGVPVEQTAGRRLRPHLVCGLTQEHYVFAGTVRSVLRIGRPDAEDTELWSALEQAGAAAWIRALPGGLDTEVRDDAAELAGGQRQRLALAAALLADPRVLVLDEPTESVDPRTADTLLRDTLAAAGDRALLLVSHRLRGLESADEIVVLRAGHVVQRGSHTELLAQEGYYRDQYTAEREAEQRTALGLTVRCARAPYSGGHAGSGPARLNRPPAPAPAAPVGPARRPRAGRVHVPGLPAHRRHVHPLIFAGNPGLQAGRERDPRPGGAKRRSSLRLRRRSGRPLLALDVVLDDAQRCAAAGPREIRRGPEHRACADLVDPAGVLRTQVAGADAFEAVDELGQGDFRRVVHKQVNVIAFTVELAQLGLEGLAHVSHDLLAARQHVVVEDLPPVLRDKHQVGVEVVNNMISPSDVGSGSQRGDMYQM